MNKKVKRLFSLYLSFLEQLNSVLGPSIPFYWIAILKRALDKDSKSLLDIGGGKGTLMKAIDKEHKYWRVNCDIFLSDLKESRERKTHDEYILCDIRYLPFKEKSFDIALASNVLEHLPKEDSLKVLKELESICCKQIVVAVPCEAATHPSPDPKNPFQAHISRWSISELQALGFKTKRCGSPLIRGESLDYYLPKVLKPIGQVYRVLGSLLGFFLPIGDCIIATKDISDKHLERPF